MLSDATKTAIRTLVRERIKQKIRVRVNPNSANNIWMNYSGTGTNNDATTAPARYWPLFPNYDAARHYIQSSLNCTATEDDPNGPLKITVYLRYDVKKTSVTSELQGPPDGTLNYEAFNAYVEGLDPGAMKPGGSYGSEEDTLNPPFIGATGITVTNGTLPGCITLLRNGTQINPST